MKTNYITTISTLLTIFVILSFHTPSHAQYILAGQTEGENIYHFDIDDIYIYGQPNNPGGAYIDIDGDGFDFLFGAYVFYSHSGNSTRTDVTPYDNTSVATIDTIPMWIEKFEYGDTIHSQMHWIEDEGIFRHQTYDSAYGVFFGEGYMAFKKTYPHYIIGWFKLDIGDANMYIKEYAFYSDTYVGLDIGSKDNYNIKYNNPVTSNLMISIESPDRIEELSYKIVNFNGAIIDSGPLEPGNNKIVISEHSVGLYILEISNKKGFKRHLKLIKI